MVNHIIGGKWSRHPLKIERTRATLNSCSISLRRSSGGSRKSRRGRLATGLTEGYRCFRLGVRLHHDDAGSGVRLHALCEGVDIFLPKGSPDEHEIVKTRANDDVAQKF